MSGGTDAPDVGGRRPRRPDESMTLLTEVMAHPLDPGYEEAARARESGARKGPSAPGRALALLVAVALGVVTVVAVRSLRAPSPGIVGARTVLQQQILERQDRADALSRSIARTNAEVGTLQSQALAAQSPSLLATVQDDTVASGAAAVSGPGVTVTVSDAADAVAADGTVDPDRRVQDSDLQNVVNALWAGGAEAVAINGQRLTSTTAIRSAGSAILVDFVGLASPYHVEAVGDPDALRSSFATSTAADQLKVLGESYGLQSSVATEKHLELEGGGPSTLQYALPLD
ncbi:DUF881 domain-containing protein [Luteimicrobium sp. DT211]|uniref:DUF881 domain-containing protein n=1 Tax=Luteimicrobium sp. DT211 TaxID=3393412 RepID=UPI003CF896EC